MVEISPAITLYMAESEKNRFRKYAEARNVTPAKLASLIVRAWVQDRIEEEE